MVKIAVYEWMGWGEFFINKIFPEAIRVEAHWTQTSDDVLSTIDGDVDCFIPHINMSVTDKIPSDREVLFEKLESRGIRVLNRNFSDITRTTLENGIKEAGLPSLSVNLDKCSDDELLIVKSNFNCGGGMERRLKAKDKEILGISGFDKKKVPAPWDYKVIKKRDLDDSTIQDPLLHIERFVSNSLDRMWRAYIFGDRISVIEAVVLGDIKKTKHSIKDHLHHGKIGETKGKISAFGGAYMDKLFSLIERFIVSLNVDFCTIDIMESSEGDYFIVDLNLTPHWGGRNKPEIIDNMQKSNLFNNL